MTVDMGTVLIVQGLVYLLSFITLYIVWINNRRQYHGILFWSVGFGLSFIGMCLMVVRSFVPVWASFVLANGLFIFGYYFLLKGSLRFTGRTIPPLYMRAIELSLLIFITLYIVFTYVNDNLAVRILLVSLMLIYLIGINFLVFQWRSVPEIKAYSKGIRIAFAIMILNLVLRALGISLVETADFLKSGAYDTMMLLIGALTTVFVAFNLILMINNRNVQQIKVLQGLMPICSYCKKIRNDEGFWLAVETYISEHSDAEFTHSLCPDCAKEHYPGLFDDADLE